MMQQEYEDQYNNFNADRMTASPKIVITNRFMRRMKSPMNRDTAQTNSNANASPTFTNERHTTNTTP